jgi:hypothetical protein
MNAPTNTGRNDTPPAVAPAAITNRAEGAGCPTRPRDRGRRRADHREAGTGGGRQRGSDLKGRSPDGITSTACSAVTPMSRWTAARRTGHARVTVTLVSEDRRHARGRRRPLRRIERRHRRELRQHRPPGPDCSGVRERRRASAQSTARETMTMPITAGFRGTSGGAPCSEPGDAWPRFINIIAGGQQCRTAGARLTVPRSPRRLCRILNPTSAAFTWRELIRAGRAS